MGWMKRTSGQLILVVITFTVSTLLGVSTLARQADSVSILMPAPFADATAELVRTFNKEHEGRIHLNVIRGPLETESISDLAISSLLLGDTPFDGLLMDVTWVSKYAKAGGCLHWTITSQIKTSPLSPLGPAKAIMQKVLCSAGRLRQTSACCIGGRT